MPNLTHHTLENTPLETIHRAFVDAFSEYEVPIDMPVEKLAEMLTTRSFCAAWSLGAFAGEALAGFILLGARELAGERVVYDVATGVTRAYQQQGLGDRLLKDMLARLPGWGVGAFVLEVLEHNTAAQKLYRRNGFEISRKFNCYQKSFDAPQAAQFPPSMGDAEDLRALDLPAYLSFAPSWQNALESYHNNPGQYHLELVGEGGEVRAYGIVHRQRGDVMQLGVDPACRSTAEVAGMLARLRAHTLSERLVFLNVEAGSALDRDLIALGFENTVNQFEMVCRVG